MFVSRCEYKVQYIDYRDRKRESDWTVGLVVTNGDKAIVLSLDCAPVQHVVCYQKRGKEEVF